MPSTVRVKFSPLPSPSSSVRHVAGGTLELVQLGAGSSAASTSEQPASISFTAVFLKGIREEVARSEQNLGQLEGQLAVDTATRNPVFKVVSPEALTLEVPLATAEDGGELPPDPRLRVRLVLASSSFEGALADLELRLPEEAQDFEHLEVRAELSIAGSVEASVDSGDVLDVPLRFESVGVTPPLCLATPVDDPADHNLALLLELPELPAGRTIGPISSVILRGKLLDPESIFQDGRRLFFFTPEKPEGLQRGLVITEDEQAFDFLLEVAETPRQQLTSLKQQIDNANLLCTAATLRSEDGALFRDEFARRLLERKIRLLTSIESTLTSNQEFAEFYSRSSTLPALQIS